MVERGTIASRSDDELAVLVRRSPDGENGRAALAELMVRWNERVYRWAYRFVGEREQALDLAQDALLHAIRGLREYETRGRFSAWLFTIVHHRCLDELRRRRHAPVGVDDIDAYEAPTDPVGRADRRLDQERVLTAMRQHLHENERVALWLQVEEGASVDDITRLLGLENASGARGVLQSARRKLRAALSESEPVRAPEEP